MGVIALLVLGGAAWYFTTDEERSRVWRSVLSHVQRVQAVVDRHRQEPDPVRDALRTRAPIPVVTAGLAAAHLLAFVFVIAGGATFSDPEGLVAWGGNFGPRTSNGEWWRLVSAMFLHASVLHLAINLSALAQIGATVERLVGRVALASVYVIAGILGGLLDLSLQPMSVSVGASPAVFGVCGLLIGCTVWNVRRQPDLRTSWRVVLRYLPVAGLLILYHLATGDLGSAGVRTGLVFGLIAGAALGRGAIEQQPPLSRVWSVAGFALAIAIAAAVSLRGIADVRPEVRRLVAIEDRTAHEYDAAANQFRLGAIKARALAQLIDRTIRPQLLEAHNRIKAITGVPREHQHLVARAEEYLRLRDESWSLRSDALHKASMVTLRKADLAERASLDAFERIKLVDQD